MADRAELPKCGVSDAAAKLDAERLDYLLRRGSELFYKELQDGYIYNKDRQCGLQTMMKYFAQRNPDQVEVSSRVPAKTPGITRGSFPSDSPDPSIKFYSIDTHVIDDKAKKTASQ